MIRPIAAAVGLSVFAFLLMNAGYFRARVALKMREPAEVPAVIVNEAAPPPTPAMPPNRLRIDSLGLDVPLVYVEEKSEAAFQLALRDGVVHYPGTAMPGEPGNAYYFGHSSDYAWAKGDYKTVFATLTELAPGALIVASNANGTSFTYVVTGTRVISPKDLSVLDQGDGSEVRLTLQTSYPLGTALKRFIVEAKLAE